jgi:hypothetical protein
VDDALSGEIARPTAHACPGGDGRSRGGPRQGFNTVHSISLSRFPTVSAESL